MLFTLSPKRVTKQTLLSEHTEEEYMSFYLGIIPDKDLHTNPLRDDKHPTASFYRAPNDELIFKDWKTGSHYNFVDIVAEKFNVPFAKAINIIANDFNISPRAKLVKNEPAIHYDGSTVEHKGETVIQAEIKDYTESDYKWWNAYGITKETLKKYNVFCVKSVFLNGSYLYGSTPHSPIYGYYFGKDNGRELWKMYFPIRQRYRFLLNTNKLQGIKQLPETGDYLVITKSLKDVMVLHELGIPAIAPQAESVILSSRQYQALSKRFKNIIINGDWDGAGQRFMFESRKRFPCVALSFTNKKKFGKDISDFVKKFGKEKAQELIDRLKEKFNEEDFLYHLNYSLKYQQ